MGEIASLKALFTGLQIPITDQWLEKCYNFCKTEVLGPRYSLMDLQKQIYHHWLAQDLRDLQITTLPGNLSTKQSFKLTGSFCLQMLQIMDISKPKLWQIQKIRNSNALTRGTQQDSEVAGTGKRVLQMTLTDGVQEVEGMEYRTIPTLSLNLAPGCKIGIVGPLMVRRGRLMLEPQNVKVLAGEVEELLICNAAENVLARWLKLPENPNPGVVPEKMLVVENEERNEGYTNDFTLKNEMKKISEKQNERLPKEIKSPDALAFEEKNIKTSTQVTNISLDDDDDDIFKDIDIEAHLDQLDKVSPPKVENVLTISKIKQLQENVSKGVFKVHAKFKCVEEKLTADKEYKLSIQIEDSTGTLIVKVHTDVVTELAQKTPQELVRMRDEYDKEESTQKIVQVLVRVKEQLLKLDTILKIQVEKDNLPLLIKIL